MPVPALLTFGLTPAIQQVMAFDRYLPNRVNRAADTQWCPSGKAVNAARAARIALTHAKSTARVLAAAPLSGFSGNWMKRELLAEGIEPVATTLGPPPFENRACHEMRNCLTVITRAKDNRPIVTEHVEEAPEWSSAEVDALIAAAVATRPDVVVCCGTLSPNAADDVYARLIGGCAPRFAIIDAKGPPLLKALGTKGGTTLIAKLNIEEMLFTAETEDFDEACTKLMSAGARHVVVTDGAKGALHFDGSETVQYRAPKVHVTNTTGCGDCLAGVLAACLLLGRPLERSLVLAAGAASVSAETMLPSAFDPARVPNLG
jgi:tagatose 6-phosphate kinase